MLPRCNTNAGNPVGENRGRRAMTGSCGLGCPHHSLIRP
ncbi:hypothetical protein CBM2637_A210137 [Cupriavidus taiwanensis]|nr:hypothetical protein CBM2637_A210137 [Cupriavidus taiwanensis]